MRKKDSKFVSLSASTTTIASDSDESLCSRGVLFIVLEMTFEELVQ